jgi:integrase
MKIENINLDERYMIGGLKTAAGKKRIIPIHAEIMPLIKAQYSPDKKYLFQSVRGNKLQYNYFAAYKFAPLMKKLKMSHTLHETRHTFISQADRVGLNGTILKKIVGHANGDITVHYTHKDISEILEEIKNFHY